jgi:hypothetical protein
VSSRLRFESYMDYAAYLGKLAAYDGGSVMPVLGPRTPVMAAVEELSWDESGRPQPDLGRVLIVHAGTSGLESLGQALAACVGATAVAVNDVGEVGVLLETYPSLDYVVFLGKGKSVADGEITRLHNQLWHAVTAGHGQVHLGVLTARDIPALSWIIAKGLAFPWRAAPASGHLRIWPAVEELKDLMGTGEWILRDRALTSEVAPRLGLHNGVISFMGHGRDDVLHLHDAVICAAGPDIRAEPGLASSRVPVCAFTGQCYRSDVPPERVIRASEVRADVVLANSCLSWRVADGLFPQEYLLAHGFMAGVAAGYVGSPALLAGSVLINDLFHYALSQGHPIGKAVSLVNDHLRGDRTDPAYFTLLGLPWVTPGPGEDWPCDGGEHFVTVPVLPDARQNGGRLTTAGLAASASGNGRHSVRPVFVSARTSPLVDAPAAGRADERAASALRTELRGLGRAINALGSMALLGFRYSRQNNLLVNLHDQISNLARALTAAATAGEAAKVARRVASLRKAVDGAELALAEAFYERGTTSFANFAEMWAMLLEQMPLEMTRRECPYCGRLLMHRRAEHPIFDRISRSCLECGHCGMVLDQDPDGPLENLELAAEELWHHGQQVRARLSITAGKGLDRPIRAYAAIYTEAARKNHIQFPSVQCVSLGPGQTAVLSVTADIPPDARAHQEFLIGFAVAEGTLNCASRPVWIRPALDSALTSAPGVTV